jgi:hypothetical protein
MFCIFHGYFNFNLQAIGKLKVAVTVSVSGFDVEM